MLCDCNFGSAMWSEVWKRGDFEAHATKVKQSLSQAHTAKRRRFEENGGSHAIAMRKFEPSLAYVVLVD